MAIRSGQPLTSFGGRRDVYSALGYPPIASITLQDFRARYDRGGIAQRIVDSYPVSTWGGGADVIDDGSPDVTTDFETDCAALDKKVKFWQSCLKADILCRIGHYSVLLIGAPGEPSTELPRLKSIKDVLYLLPVPEIRAQISQWDVNPASERFGLPLYYNLTVGSTSAGSNATTQRVVRTHWSRVLHFADKTLDNPIYGTPALQACWNRLEDYDKVVGGGSEAVWQRADPGLHANINSDVSIDNTELDALSEELEAYKHGLNRTLMTRNVDVNPLSSSVFNFGPCAAAIVDDLAATSTVPQRILMGSERGELASSQDDDNWQGRVAERRKTLAIPVAYEFFGRMVQYGAIRAPRNVDYQIKWPTRNQLSDRDRVSIAVSLATANYQQSTADGRILIQPNEIRTKYLELEADPGLEQVPEPAPPQIDPSNTDDPQSQGDGNDGGSGKGEPPGTKAN